MLRGQPEELELRVSTTDLSSSDAPLIPLPSSLSEGDEEFWVKWTFSAAVLWLKLKCIIYKIKKQVNIRNDNGKIIQEVKHEQQWMAKKNDNIFQR